MTMTAFIFVLELIGACAFAISGAFVGIRKNLDIFGVCIMGLSTAVGGGILRDIILGTTPPVMFTNPIYAIVALLTCVIVFSSRVRRFIDKRYVLLMFFDAIGLGIFTVSGAMRAYEVTASSNIFLAVFVGVITGAGGGLLRDMMANETPYIFTKHIYATASIAGGILFCILFPLTGRYTAMMAGAFFIVILRMLAMYYRWSLPKLEKNTAD